MLPEGLPDMPPGRRLARLLSTLDPTRLNGWQLVVVLEAQNRQLAHDQARMLATARELAYAPPSGPDSPPQRQGEANHPRLRKRSQGRDDASQWTIGPAIAVTRSSWPRRLAIATFTVRR